MDLSLDMVYIGNIVSRGKSKQVLIQ
jgi:hypothetical protein